VDIDFISMREAFRAIDTSNTGIITKEQVKKGFAHDSHITHINHEMIEEIFSRFKDGQINYSHFLAATVDKKVALNKANLEFAFHHFDTENKGFITKKDLNEVFRR
jgi:calcium-dependent protein kinase